ncbi:alanine--tRNA ligase [Pseudactinotalea sp. HY160]|uniref:alanine--tRNA ligase n=1 Tax=Pseudactinotalea sp. HY160 TaxID=2654490 RepID=UPI00128DC4F5|nr:alanine--tRNA ligase [Pseudactinotalea sp. HY160]MPV49351.1 alanine--tRNA ligase [Pseudactinotalea sp. HY160]
MRTAEIRRRWLTFFADRGHAVVPSSSVISPDPSTLFVIAGMVPFIPYMLAEQQPPWSRATSVQKCVRTADIDEVGKTTRHGTFFQMNGNFSFGDYFKEQAIRYAWEFVTGAEEEGCLGFDPADVWVTVYTDDHEAAAFWQEIAGLPAERIQRRGMADNYWSTGARGPAGPCSEIYIDRGPAYGAEGGPVVDEDRYLEIWNLVFMQYERGDGGTKDDFPILGDLTQKNIDTGMGLERVALLKQGVDNLYEIDQVYPVIAATERLSGKKYGENHEDDVRMRVVADHVRSALMLIGDGIRPGNEGRGYVLRRLLRRAIRAVRLLGVEQEALPVLLPTSKDAMKESYPELDAEFDRISRIAYTEEASFRRTLESGLSLLTGAVARLEEAGVDVLPGADAFALHDTHGFPIDLTLEMAAERGLSVDEATFRRLMTEQKQRARTDALAKRAGHADTQAYQQLRAELDAPVTFLGYDESEARSRVVGLLADGVPVPAAHAPADVEVILAATPFYAEAGGQLADHGTLRLDGGGLVEVDDVQAPIKGMPLHRGRLVDGSITLDEGALAAISTTRRLAISRAHTATHIVHKAVREALGDTATQAGSENAPSRVRFDFRSGTGLPAGALSEVEERANARLMDDLEVTDQVMDLDDARAAGAMALFGEKYGSRVRVVSVGGDWSRELCGGTHVASSGRIGRITLLSEASIGSGVRRIDALVGTGAHEFHAREHALVGQLSQLVGARGEELPERISGLLTRLKDAEREVATMRAEQVLARAGSLLDGAARIGALRVIVADLGPVGSADDVRTLALDLRERSGAEPAVVALVGVAGERPVVVVAVNPAARAAGVKAGALVRVAATRLGGGGGGKDDLAQGGGTDPAATGAAVAALSDELAAAHG